jgi:hypothetical protein
VVDIFGASSGPPDRGDERPLEAALERSRLLGAELDPRYRVLAVTLEVPAEPAGWELGDDLRVQLLCHPVSTILASLRRDTGGTKELLAFDEAQLVDVVAALDAPVVQPPLFGRAEPRPGEWGPRFSFEGRSTAPDGVTQTLTLQAVAGDLSFNLFARFDELELKDATGQTLPLPG